MPSQLVVGAGLIGKPLAERLAARGDAVTIATRSATPATGASAIRLDAADTAGFIRAAEGADTIFLCTNPPYTKWPVEWPPIFTAAINAANASGAGLVIMGNLYPYGTPQGPMSEHSPELTAETKGLVRKAGWDRAAEAVRRGEIRAVEVRASDYFGPGSTGTAHLGDGFFHAILASKTARVVGRPDLPHSWSYLPDIVTTLIAAADNTGPWGRVWHVPSNEPASRNEIADQINAGWGVHGRVARIPSWAIRTLGVASPMMREVAASSYQFVVPFVIDSHETERLLGVSATEWSDALATTVESYR